jgi:hypothetical protein
MHGLWKHYFVPRGGELPFYHIYVPCARVLYMDLIQTHCGERVNRLPSEPVQKSHYCLMFARKLTRIFHHLMPNQARIYIRIPYTVYRYYCACAQRMNPFLINQVRTSWAWISKMSRSAEYTAAAFFSTVYYSTVAYDILNDSFMGLVGPA